MTTSDQRRIDWDESCLRRHLETCGLPRVEIELVVLLNRSGRRRDRDGSHRLELCVSKRNAAKEMRCSPNAVVKAAEKLVERGLLAVLHFGPSPTYVLSLDRLAKLEPPPDPLADIDPFAEGWSPVVTGGHRPRAPRGQENIKPRCNRESRDSREARGGSRGGEVTSGDHLTPPRNGSGRLRDVTDEEVRTMDLERLMAGFYDAVSQGWLEHGPDDLRKYLATCHHAATSPTLRSPAAVVYAAVADYRFDRVKLASWAWVEKHLAGVLGRFPALAEAIEER